MKKVIEHCQTLIVGSILFIFSSIANAGGMDAQCPDSKYFEGLVDKVCWSCMLPISLFGLTEPPAGANTDFACACPDEFGIPMPGFAAGFFQPDQLMEVSNIPWCSPTLGGVQLSEDYTHIGNSIAPKNGESERQPLVQMHYNYLASPILKMMNLLMIPECEKTPGVVDLDIMFMSPLTAEWYDDLLSFVLTPDAAAFANPIGQAMCVYDCGLTMATGEASEANWHCGGCDGSLYPLTGNVTGSADNPIKTSSLITQRAIAKSHRLGLSAKTMGKKAMCEFVYTPMIPKSQYKLQLSFPIAESGGECCHPLGANWLTWGLGRIAPGGGKDSTFVYNVFRYADCCIPIL
ncbi:TraU family protein [Aliivibrio fischeri]|uniref:TraU family protein n=1 Tax=Aliivibrio fischeri TaxID=668 RepID=UPI0012D989F5|nr:TraU family protein [Aliivibrio fischeri]MUJ20336.1 conjugal transfer protein TraU [Aliivibrio fischeri]